MTEYFSEQNLIMLSVLENILIQLQGLLALRGDQHFIGLLDLICKWKVIVRRQILPTAHHHI
jgi:hypothetical protein